MGGAPSPRKQSGFTIVELLIVVIVIAILATITIVSFGAIQNRAHDSAVQSDLRQLGLRIQSYYHDNSDTLPVATGANFNTVESGLKLATGSYGTHYNNGTSNYNMLYCRNATTKQFALVAGSKSGAMYSYRDGKVSPTTAFGSGSATCTANGITSASVYWLYGQSGSNAWAWQLNS